MARKSLSEMPNVVGKPKFTANVFANILVVVAIIAIPLMYGGILSSAYQDPLERMGHIQAAVVNEDQPFDADLVSGSNMAVDVGRMLTDALVHPEDGEDTGFTWEEMSADQAERAMKSQSVRAVLYIPAGLSEEVSQIGTASAADTVSARLNLVTDDGINYLSGTLARTVAATLQDRVSSEASSIYAEALLESLGTIRTGMGTAVDGSTALADGSTVLADGLTELDEGARAAAAGATQLDSGAGELASGTNTLADKVPELQTGVSALGAGSSALASGAATLSGGVNQYTAGVDQVAAGTATLRAQTPSLQAGISSLQTGSAQLAAGSSQLDESFKQISEPVAQLAPLPGEIRDLVTGVSNSIDAVYQQCVALHGETDPLCRLVAQMASGKGQIVDKVDQVAGKADEAIAGVAAAQTGMDQIAAASGQVNQGLTALQASVGTTSDTAASQTVLGGVNSIDDGLGTLSGTSATLRGGANELASGSKALEAGVGTLQEKVPTLVSGVDALNSGAGALAAGATDLSTGLNSLSAGASSAASGSSALAAGSAQLEEGLVAGQEQIPDYSQTEATQIAETSSHLVQIDPVREREVNNTGAGYSPMFISLALWIGGIAIFLVLPALDRRPGPGETWWMAAARPAATASILAVVQATAAVLGTNWLVELHAVNVGAMLGIGILASLTFVAVNQACVATLGYRGRFVSIVLLLLQIASMGATFPIETMPAFFNWVHPLLPMTYTQLAFRSAIAGGGIPGIMGSTVAILMIWLVICAALVLLAAYLRTRNHPLPYDAALLPDNYPAEDEVGVATLAGRRDIKRELLAFARARLAAFGVTASQNSTLGTLGPKSTTDDRATRQRGANPTLDVNPLVTVSDAGSRMGEAGVHVHGRPTEDQVLGQ